LRALNRAGALLHKILVAGIFVGGELERGLRFCHLLRGLVDLGSLSRNLSIDVFYRRFVLPDLPFRLIDFGSVIARVDGREQVAIVYNLIVDDVDADNLAGNFRTDQHRPAVDKSIVRAFVVPGMNIPRDAGDDAN